MHNDLFQKTDISDKKIEIFLREQITFEVFW